MASDHFKGKVALVTGAQQGIGEAMALAFAEAGADVAINWLNDQRAAEAVAAGVRRSGRRALLVQADVGQVAQCADLVAKTVAGLGSVDILVNNAGIFPRSWFFDTTEAEWDRVMAVNLKASFFTAQAAAKAMAAKGGGGSIIHISSQAVRGAETRSVHYTASKGAIVAMTRSMALEMAKHDIRVNSIAPGLIDTAQPRDGHSEAELAEMASRIPLPRLGQPAEIAKLAVYLAGPDAVWMTGQTVHLNGGAYMP